MAFVKSAVRLAKKYLKSRIDYSKFPTLDPADVIETVAKGSGPGGQSVNKSLNAVRLNHGPTGVTVRCHDTRSREKNKEIALVRLRDAVDLHLNGEDSVASQIRRIEQERLRRKKEERAKRREEKAAAKRTETETEGDSEEAGAEEIEPVDATTDSSQGIDVGPATKSS